MHPRRPISPPLVNAVDQLGRRIDPAVLSIALEVAPRALSYAQRLLGDPATAINYLEEAAASVSIAIEQKRLAGVPEVRDIPAYLFRVFVRRVDEARRKENGLEVSLQTRSESEACRQAQVRVETTILLNEVMATCERASREIVILRLEGFSWEEIGQQFGISAHAAEVRFSKALDHARKTLKIPRRKGSGEFHPCRPASASRSDTDGVHRQTKRLLKSAESTSLKTFRTPPDKDARPTTY